MLDSTSRCSTTPAGGSSVVGHARKLADTPQGASQAATAATSAALP